MTVPGDPSNEPSKSFRKAFFRPSQSMSTQSAELILLQKKKITISGKREIIMTGCNVNFYLF
jgi:hypothetical protein